MRWIDLIVTALRSIRARALRSLLTMITAAVGIAGVTSSVALTDGITHQVERDVRSLGVRVVEVVTPAIRKLKGQKVKAELTDETLKKLRAAFPDLAVAPTRLGPHMGWFEGREKPMLSLGIGTDENMPRMFDVGMAQGRFFDATEAARAAKVCVLDSALAQKAFGDADPIGKKVFVWFGMGGLNLEVIGVVEDPFSLRQHFDSLDSLSPARQVFARTMAYRNIYFPIRLLAGGEEKLHTIKIAARRPEDVDALFRDVKKVVGKDLAKLTWSQKDWVEIVVKTTNEFNLLGNLLWVAILFVTAVLIGTVNLIAVRERFREMGIRLTEGATPLQIWLQLVIENMVLSLAGGVLGIALGIPTGWFLSRIVAEWDPAFTARGLILPVVVAAALGVLSTFWPAWKAARVNIVDILRRG